MVEKDTCLLDNGCYQSNRRWGYGVLGGLVVNRATCLGYLVLEAMDSIGRWGVMVLECCHSIGR